MGALWLLLKNALTADDLFWRVSCFLFALLVTSLGILVCYLLLGPDREAIWWVWRVPLWGLAGGFFVWAALLLGGSFGPPESRWTRRARYAMPPAIDFDGEIYLTVVIALLPAAVLTIVLRCIGVRGCKSSRDRSAFLLP
jgi:hypothetical protein